MKLSFDSTNDIHPDTLPIEVKNTFSSELQTLIELKNIYKKKGRRKTFDLFLQKRSLQSHLPQCLSIKELGPSKNTVLRRIEAAIRFLKGTLLNPQKNWSQYSKKISYLKWDLLLKNDGDVKLYAIGKTLGKGTFKTIKPLISLTDETFFAIAKVNKAFRNNGAVILEKERLISQTLNDAKVPFILKMWALSYKNKTKNMMEFCDRGTLTDYLKSTPPLAERMRLGLEIVQAIEGMHFNKLCHLDMKSTNILVKTEGNIPHIRLADFGTVKSSLDSTYLCSSYPPPEMALIYKESYGKIKVEESLDMWSVADILYKLKFGSSPLSHYHLAFSDLDKEASDTKNSPFLNRVELMTQDLKQTLFHSKDPFDKALLRAFSINPKERPSAKELLCYLTPFAKP